MHTPPATHREWIERDVRMGMATPESIASDPFLTTDRKVELLSQLEYDARELSVAEEEGMGGGPSGLLHRIHRAFERIGYHRPSSEHPTTKHGGS